MTKHQIVPAGLEHALQLAPRLRKGDLAEIKAASGMEPEDALVLSLAMAPKSWAWLYKGRVMAVFGVSPHPYRDGVGVPWLLAANIGRHKTYFVRQSRRYVAEMLAEFPVLENYVDCRNTASIQWLHWCGFALAEVVPFYGVQRLPFIRFFAARSQEQCATP